ncbi:MAG: Competence protein ComM [Firmicutes bacterium ADurb.Bin182]|nr:MAG: Competence protein ComM [Firmicutes bacterium ADurb.Bin182]
MLSNVLSHGLSGINGFSVQVEVDISNGLPGYETVGLPDAAVRESKERVRAAIKNSGFEFPMSRITVNLAPAELRKEGSVYDLPIAIGILAATGQIPCNKIEGILFLGELSLDGVIREISGVLPMVIDAYSNGVTSVVLPKGNAAEAAYIKGVRVISVNTLREAVSMLKGETEMNVVPPLEWDSCNLALDCDFSEIKGQQGAKRAAEIAVAGSHNILLIGTPGSGKTMLARSIPSILPELTFDEALEITKIHSIVGAVKGANGIICQRPFRSPHHSASAASLVGGGQKALPGEISLAHYGVLFLDEFPEFRKDVLESLRQPLEDGFVTIARAAAKSTYPADFMLVAAMNPCPCGNYGSRMNQCRCTPSAVQRYQSRISGPLLDRIDMHIEMTEVGYSDISGRTTGESSKIIRDRINSAREIQRERYKKDGILFNAQLTNKLTLKYCKLDDEGEGILRKAFSALKLSARAYGRILRVSRTIADIENSDRILPTHVAEAIQYRSLDRKLWGDRM